MSKVAIIATGDELLNGITADTNSAWLVRRLVAIGATVTRIVTVPDDHEQIIRELKEAVEYGNDLIITMGGLGPTFDDQTLDAVAEFAGVQMETREEALVTIGAHYEGMHDSGMTSTPEITPERAQMAWVPEGCILLNQTVGAAPGVLMKGVNGSNSAICSLPGVPPEMKEIFGTSLRPHLAEIINPDMFNETTFITDAFDESELAGPLAEFKKGNPDLYVKSRGSSGTVLVTIGIRDAQVEDPSACILHASADLEDALHRVGILIAGKI